MPRFIAILFALIFLSAGAAYGDGDRTSANTRKFDPKIEKLDLAKQFATMEAEKAKLPDARFEKIAEIRLTVPAKYDHRTQLSTFKTQTLKHIEVFQPYFAGGFMAANAYPLVPGKTYIFRIFTFTAEVNYDDCRTFLKATNARCVGAPGLALLWQLRRDALPVNKALLAFGMRDMFHKNDPKETGILPLLANVQDQRGDLHWLAVLIQKEEFDTSYCLLCVYDE